jgi:hypothetical protein
VNIFYLDADPAQAAFAHCDKHVVKMILEYAQLLSTAHHEFKSEYISPNPPIIDDNGQHISLYKPTHRNHPSAIWVRQSPRHYSWTLACLYALSGEYTWRYGKTHKTTRLFPLLTNAPKTLRDCADTFSPPPQCMPDEYKHADTVQAYRNYYNGAKRSILKYTKREQPTWLTM